MKSTSYAHKRLRKSTLRKHIRVGTQVFERLIEFGNRKQVKVHRNRKRYNRKQLKQTPLQ